MLSGLIGAYQPFAAGAEPAAKDAIFPYPIHQTVLDNGLKVLSVPFDSPGIISYYTIVRTGSRNEIEPGLSGFAHFFEHMMFRGTPRYSQEQYNDAMKQLGADSNAFTTDDWTAYHTTAAAGALGTIIELEADRFQNLSYDEAGFQKEARAVLGEYNKIASSPYLLLDETLQDTAYNKHTYKHTTIGFLKDIVDMPNQYEYSKKFFDRWYRPDNCIVLVVGDVQHNQLVQLAKRHYGSWKAGAAKIDIPTEPQQTGERRKELAWEGPTLPHLYIGYHAPAFDATSRDVAALDVLSEALFSQVSPLYRKLVLDEARVESLSAGAAFRRDPTLFTVMARVRDPQDLAAVEQAIYEQLQQAADQPLDSQRLADIKSHLRYQVAIGMDSTNAVARGLGYFLQLTADPDSLNETYATYEQVTAEDVQRVAKKFFAPTNRTVITLKSKEAETTSIGHGRGLKFQPISFKSPEKEAPQLPSATPPALPQNGFRRALPVIQRQAVARQLRRVAVAKRAAETPSTSPLVALRIGFRVGSQDDPKGKEGLAALTARMLSEGGSQKVAYAELLEKLYPLAASMGGDCDKELTVFAGEVHRDKLGEFYELMADTLLRPRFDPSDFSRLRDEQVSALEADLRGNDDENLGKWTLQLAIYPPSHPYGHVDTGTVQGLKAITLDDVKEFYRTHYTSAKVEPMVAGGVDDAFRTKLAKDFESGLPQAEGKAEAPSLPAPPAISDLELTIVEKPTIATAISLGFPVNLTRADDDFYALAVANSAFGEHRTFNGRLMQNMRGKRGLNYGDYAYIENFIQDGGSTFALPGVPRRQQFFSIWIRPVPHDKGAFALRQSLRELDTLVRDGLTQEEFEATRNFLLNYSKLWVQTQSRRLGYEMDGSFYGRDDLVAELEKRLPTLTLEQVNAAIKKHLQPKNVAVAVVTDDGAKFRDTILSGEATPLVYDTQGTPPEILTEDKEIAVWPLNVNKDKLRIVPAGEMFER
jgi:zinc protease